MMFRYTKRITAILLTIVCLALLTACGTTKSADITTPYANLTLPDDYDGAVTSTVISEDPYTLAFKAEDGTELFTLYFGKEKGSLIGTLEQDGEQVAVYADFSDLDEDSQDYETYAGYQEGINTIIEGLTEDYEFTVGQLVEDEDDSTFNIKTSVVTMKYPQKWKDKVQVEVSDKRVEFSNDGTPLFDLVFKKCDGYLLGTYDGTPIYIIDYDVDTDDQMAMQEDVNVILQYLMEDEKFEINMEN